MWSLHQSANYPNDRSIFSDYWVVKQSGSGLSPEARRAPSGAYKWGAHARQRAWKRARWRAQTVDGASTAAREGACAPRSRKKVRCAQPPFPERPLRLLTASHAAGRQFIRAGGPIPLRWLSGARHPAATCTRARHPGRQSPALSPARPPGRIPPVASRICRHDWPPSAPPRTHHATMNTSDS